MAFTLEQGIYHYATQLPVNHKNWKPKKKKKKGENTKIEVKRIPALVEQSAII